jgi:hypothetical protein
MYETEFQDEHKPVGPRTDRPYLAEINNTPTSDGQDLFVTIEGIDGGQHAWGPCYGWESRITWAGSASHPYKGASALVQFDDDHNVWLLAWWPYA